MSQSNDNLDSQDDDEYEESTTDMDLEEDNKWTQLIEDIKKNQREPTELTYFVYLIVLILTLLLAPCVWSIHNWVSPKLDHADCQSTFYFVLFTLYLIMIEFIVYWGFVFNSDLEIALIVVVNLSAITQFIALIVFYYSKCVPFYREAGSPWQWDVFVDYMLFRVVIIPIISCCAMCTITASNVSKDQDKKLKENGQQNQDETNDSIDQGRSTQQRQPQGQKQPLRNSNSSNYGSNGQQNSYTPSQTQRNFADKLSLDQLKEKYQFPQNDAQNQMPRNTQPRNNMNNQAFNSSQRPSHNQDIVIRSNVTQLQSTQYRQPEHQ